MAATLCLLACGWANAAALRAGEWPQILGPHRNGQADGERLATDWPAGGPPVLWQRDVGRGFAGVAVAQGRAILFHRIADQEIAEAMDAATGKVLWRQPFAARYRSAIVPDDGPRCVPLVHQGRVLLLSAAGDLHCLRLEDGHLLWSRAAAEEFGAQEGYFGFGSSPLVEGGSLLVNLGGRDGAGIVAFSLDTGQTLWKSTQEAASYASPVAATIDGKRQVIFVTRLHCLSLDPQDGSVRFRFPFGRRGPTVNAANPLVIGRHLFLTASYGVGAKLARIENNQATIVWENDQSLSSQYVTAVAYRDVLYGIDGREDLGVARLRAIDPWTGKVFWSEEQFGTASLIVADAKLLLVKTQGELVLAEPSPEAFRPLVSRRVFEATTRALPALAEGRLYVRDTKTLKCLDVGLPQR